MGIEIERKFVVNDVPNTMMVGEKQIITQNYLAIGDEEVRVRMKQMVDVGVEYTLGVKRGSGIEREEITHVISKETFEQLNGASLRKPIIKTRTIIPYNAWVIEVDQYQHIDLVVAEVEFDSMEVAETFQPPTWFGEDVTEDKEFKNQSLWKKLNY